MIDETNGARRDFLKAAAVLPAAALAPWAMAQNTLTSTNAASAGSTGPDIAPVDRVFITNEDSNTSV